jgi:hypothetical protein
VTLFQRIVGARDEPGARDGTAGDVGVISGAGRGAEGVSDAGPGTTGAERPGTAGRPLAPWAFASVAVASFGGPLALAALVAPATVADAGDSTGLATLISALIFAAPLLLLLRYGRHVSGSGGLFGFVEAAAGRRVALAQAAIWIVSYALYLVYTTVQIVYDILPTAIPGERHYQSLLAVLIPVALAAVMVAGRATAMIVIGLMAAGQLMLDGRSTVCGRPCNRRPAEARARCRSWPTTAARFRGMARRAPRRVWRINETASRSPEAGLAPGEGQLADRQARSWLPRARRPHWRGCAPSSE